MDDQRNNPDNIRRWATFGSHSSVLANFTVYMDHTWTIVRWFSGVFHLVAYGPNVLVLGRVVRCCIWGSILVCGWVLPICMWATYTWARFQCVGESTLQHAVRESIYDPVTLQEMYATTLRFISRTFYLANYTAVGLVAEVITLLWLKVTFPS